MRCTRRLLGCLAVLLGGLSFAWWNLPSQAYVEAPMSLGAVVNQSSHILLMRVQAVDKEKNLIIFKKVRDIKGTHPQDVIKHNIGRGGLRPNEWKPQMDWAEPGKMAIFFHNGGASETCIGTWWYQAYAGGEWWNHSHAEPFLLRSFCGSPEKLAGLVAEMLQGREVVAPCMIDGNKDDLHNRRAKIQRLKVSLKIQDYNPKRDFVGWGGEDFRRLAGMPGFTHISSLTRVDPEAQGISSVDYDGDGKADVALVGGGRVVVLQNGGEALSEAPLPGAVGSRAAVWADYNSDGKPDLLLATPAGPRLYTNLGAAFRDDSHLLPQEPFYQLTAAAWIDYDADGKPDILLANGYHGLRLYRNRGALPPPSGAATPKLGKWHYLGPLNNTGGKAFAATHPVEKAVDLKQVYDGKGGEKAVWREGKFKDGEVNSLTLFKPQHNFDAAVYLYREIEVGGPMELPIALGSDDTLSVWLNGQQILANPNHRACAPDQDRVTLKLKEGKNTLLLKICQGGGDWAFYFAAGQHQPPIPQGKAFVDVSAQVGLGPEGLGNGLKGDTLTVADVNGDGRPDILFGAGRGLLLLGAKTDAGPIFVESKSSGISYTPGKIGPIFGDFDNDGFPDLFVPQNGQCKLFKNDGRGRFTDVTAKAGDLSQSLGWATSAAWGDFDNDGHLDLLVGCLRGCNRFFRNRGDGTFEDATAKVGLEQRIFNSQGVCLVDLNNDGMLDMVFNNEGQDACVLLGNPGFAGKRTPVALTIKGNDGVLGSRVQVVDQQGKLLGVREVSGGDGRGGQQPAQLRFTLAPGAYRVLVRYSSGLVRGRELIVAADPLRLNIDEQTPRVE